MLTALKELIDPWTAFNAGLCAWQETSSAPQSQPSFCPLLLSNQSCVAWLEGSGLMSIGVHRSDCWLLSPPIWVVLGLVICWSNHTCPCSRRPVGDSWNWHAPTN